jgi:hypothetical protein
MPYDILAEERARLDEEREVVEEQIRVITGLIARGDASVCAVAAGQHRSIGEMRLTALMKRREDLDTQRARLCEPESHPAALGVNEIGTDTSVTLADSADSEEVETE